jgi:hypothetical protein
MAFDVKNMKQDERLIAGAGIASLIFAFFPGYGVSVSVAGFHRSASTSVWSMGALAKFAILFAIFAAAFVVARAAGASMPELPAGPALVTLALAGLGTLLIVIRLLHLPDVNGFLGASGIHAGRKIGLYLAVIASIVQTAVAFKSFKASGEKVPKMPGSSAT